jgi:membrane-bound serine protease (ClpP class)
VSTIIGIIVAFVFFDGVWTAVVLGAFLLFDVFEIMIWLRWRKKRAITGAEGIIGHKGRAVSDLNPEGRVRVKGQTWRAVAESPVENGDYVEVVATEGLQLMVRPADREFRGATL